MKQVCSQNPTLISSERKRWRQTQTNQRKSSSLAREEERIARFSRWWDSKWPLEITQTRVPEELMRTSTKSCRLSRPRRLNRSFSPRPMPLLTPRSPTRNMSPLEQEHRLSLKVRLIKAKRKSKAVKTGEWANSTMTRMITNTSQSKLKSTARLDSIPKSRSSRRKLANMQLEEERRRPPSFPKDQSWMKTSRHSMISETRVKTT